jgi:hypothetical protein
MLLGSRAKTELQNKVRKEIVDLVGAYPTAAEAAEWKITLRTFLKEGQAGLDRLSAERKLAKQRREEKARRNAARPPVARRGIRSFHAQQTDQERFDRIKQRFRIRGGPADGSREEP